MENNTEVKPQEQTSKYKISKETAELELKKMLDFYEIEIDEIEDKDLKRIIKAGYWRLVKAVRYGRLKFELKDGTISICQYTRNKNTEIKYREIDGVAKMAMSGYDSKDYYGQSYGLMGSLCGLGEAAILQQIKGVDLSLLEVLGMIFLSV